MTDREFYLERLIAYIEEGIVIDIARRMAEDDLTLRRDEGEDGLIDDFRVYQRALSPGEISALYTSRKA
jgi:hypothetical protein